MNLHYREPAGSLRYLVIETWPTLAFLVHKLLQLCEALTQEHWSAVRPMTIYLKDTLRLRAWLSGSKDFLPHEFSDSARTADFNDWKSTSANVFEVANEWISWWSSKQAVVATFTCEPEYMSLGAAWTEQYGFEGHSLIQCLPCRAALIVFSDSHSAIILANTEAINSRSNQIDIVLQFGRDGIEHKEVDQE